MILTETAATINASRDIAEIEAMVVGITKSIRWAWLDKAKKRIKSLEKKLREANHRADNARIRVSESKFRAQILKEAEKNSAVAKAVLMHAYEDRLAQMRLVLRDVTDEFGNPRLGVVEIEEIKALAESIRDTDPMVRRGYRINCSQQRRLTRSRL